MKVDQKPIFLFFSLSLLCSRVEVYCVDTGQDCTLDAKPLVALEVDNSKIP